ncbi:MAG: HAD-IA family hydrolase [Oscillospiraceae bacterium]|nr:HAD-IA family hydrolase [Oscillospiraceae bacterium]
MPYSFIWDMDGTLVDSYPAIVPAILDVCAAHGLELPAEAVHEHVIRTSVGELLSSVGHEHALDPKQLISEFNVLNDSRTDAIRAIPHAEEALLRLSDAGHRNFVYTHRGASCRAILQNTGLLPYFTELVTALDGFARKPAPDAILYLMEKHRLSPSRCFYVGDRSLDIEAAENAGIGGILYLDPSSPGKACGRETYLVSDLLEIPALFAGGVPA